MLEGDKELVKTPANFVRLWRNECSRNYYDRLINQEDKEIFANEMSSIVKTKFPSMQEEVLAQPLLFGDIRNIS